MIIDEGFGNGEWLLYSHRSELLIVCRLDIVWAG